MYLENDEARMIEPRLHMSVSIMYQGRGGGTTLDGWDMSQLSQPFFWQFGSVLVSFFKENITLK